MKLQLKQLGLALAAGAYLLSSLLTEKIGPDKYPGDFVPSPLTSKFKELHFDFNSFVNLFDS